MNTGEVLATIKKLGRPQTAGIYKRHGSGEQVFGVLTSEIAKLQKKIKVNHALAILRETVVDQTTTQRWQEFVAGKRSTPVDVAPAQEGAQATKPTPSGPSA